MSDKEKKIEKDEPEKTAPKAKAEAKPEPAPAPQPVEPNAPRPARSGIFGRRSGESGESKADLFTLAEATGTNSIILAALKAAYGWTERTRLTRAEFLQMREAWLKRPAKEA